MLDSFSTWFSRGKTKASARCCCFHFGRCGSTLLGNLLNARAEIDWQGELLHPFHEKEVSVSGVNDPLELITKPLQQSKQPVFGFEAKFQHLDDNGLNLPLGIFVDTLISNGFEKFIVLKRQNYLRQAISVARGQASGLWHQKRGQPKPASDAVRLDVDAVSLGGKNREITKTFQVLDDTYTLATNCFTERIVDVLNLEYERDLENEPQVGFDKACLYLGLKSQPGHISVEKLGGQPLEEMVLNLAEIKERLQSTPWQWMLEN
jgi:LPS sulfotransferase NodH